jgi:hypothetical protein
MRHSSLRSASRTLRWRGGDDDRERFAQREAAQVSNSRSVRRRLGTILLGMKEILDRHSTRAESEGQITWANRLGAGSPCCPNQQEVLELPVFDEC